MSADDLLEWLDAPERSQRDTLASLGDHVPTIRALDDEDHARVLRAIKKRLKSPKLAGELTELVRALTVDRAPRPRPVPAEPARAPAPPSVPPVHAGELEETRGLLEAAIAADPDRRDSYLVLGDWLASRDDPQGELVTIGAALAKAPTHAAMIRAHREHLATHATRILGPLESCLDLVTEVDWHMGFIRACRVASTSNRFNRELLPDVPIADVMGWLLDDPGPARFLQRLTVGIVKFDGNRYREVTDVIARKPRPSLRTLFLGDFGSEETELNWSAIDGIDALWPMVPELRELTLRSGSIEVGPIDLPRLERLTTITGGLDEEEAEHLARASWPALTELSLQFGRGHEGAVTDVAVVDPILAGTRLPRLRTLGLTNQEFGDAVCERLVTARVLPQLAVLDLSMSTLTDDGARTLHANAARFQHLERLDVSENYLTDDGCALLTSLAREVITGHQRRVRHDGDRQALAYE